MKPTDISLLQSVSHPTVSPDGSRVVFAVSRPDLGADTSVGQLWQVPSDGSAPARRLTRGFHDAAPSFSPDGSLLAFLRSTADGAPQLHVIDAVGGEPVAVTDQKLGVSEFSWSPDGRRIVFVSRVPEHGRYGTVEGVGASAEPARLITTTRYLANGLGYTTDRRAQIFVADVPDVFGEPFVKTVPSIDDESDGDKEARGEVPTPVQVTSDDADHAHPRFTPDNRAVTFVAALHAGRDTDLRSSAWAVGISADGAFTTTTEILGGDLGVDDVVATESGTTFVLASDLGASGRDFVGTNAALYALTEAGAEPRRLTDPETVDLGASALVPIDDDAVLVVDTTRGTVQLLRVDSQGTVTRLTDGPVEVSGYATAAGTTAVSLATPESAGDVAVVRDGGLDTLTDFSAALRLAGTAAAPELVVTARDGSPVHGWVLTPEGEGPHPTLLVIHGGPYSQYTGSLFDEAQVYVGAGYGVVMCNPRGAAGYGQSFGRSIKEAMGTVDMDDVLDFLDGALAENSRLDASRVGIMGGSYGGYLTAWTIAHEHRFAGAIVERGFLDPEFFIGVSDIGTYFSEEYASSDPAKMAEQSPQAFVSQVTTPTFVIHSEDDLRCPLSQAQRYHLGLVRAGVDTKMLVFPGENHELSRSGRPRHRVQRFEAILDWWSQYLPVEAA
ncbi:S9 family peptidase [Frondihabitans cladoniiphilus]|uniref:S9 family peptidase n=1 Tax=Frondihabitans cladoniiphilus TaxID=715785 RepID=A0ABP8W8Z1_9MICO